MVRRRPSGPPQPAGTAWRHRPDRVLLGRDTCGRRRRPRHTAGHGRRAAGDAGQGSAQGPSRLLEGDSDHQGAARLLRPGRSRSDGASRTWVDSRPLPREATAHEAAGQGLARRRGPALRRPARVALRAHHGPEWPPATLRRVVAEVRSPGRPDHPRIASDAGRRAHTLHDRRRPAGGRAGPLHGQGPGSSARR